MSIAFEFHDEACDCRAPLFSYVEAWTLLNWFTKSSRFEQGFKDTELLWSFSRSIQWVLLLLVFVQQERKFLLLNKELNSQKEKLCQNILCNTRICSCFEDTCSLTRLFKSFKFGNGSRMSDKNLVIFEFKYLQNKKWRCQKRSGLSASRTF